MLMHVYTHIRHPCNTLSVNPGYMGNYSVATTIPLRGLEYLEFFLKVQLLLHVKLIETACSNLYHALHQ